MKNTKNVLWISSVITAALLVLGLLVGCNSAQGQIGDADEL